MPDSSLPGKVAIVGVDESDRIGVVPDKSMLQLHAEGARNALRDAGLTLKDVDGPRWLTPPALETLSVVAYRQPVLRADVEAIRGVACGEILRQLMERDLLRIVGRSEELGRPLWYGTTKRFLEVFGLCSLDDLPLAAVLRRPEEVEPGQQPVGVDRREDSAPDRSELLDAA